MTISEHFKLNFNLAWPVMLGQLGHVMVGLADSIMIGRLGTIPLAAGAFANSIFVVPMVFGLGLAMGLTPPIANADGEGKAHKAGSFLKHGLVLNIIASILLLAVILLFSLFTADLGQEPAVVKLANPYLLIITSSIIPLLTFMTFKQFAEGLSDTRFAMIASLGANLLNIFLNYLLIYGHWGFPHLGLNGAGIATLISRVIMAAAMGWYVFKGRKFRIYLEGFSQLKWHKGRFMKILSIGVPSGFQSIFEISAFAIAAIIVGQISAEALAAHQIAISLAALSYMMASGIGAAAAVRVGNQMGRRDFRAMRTAGRTSLIMTLIFMAACGLVFLIGRNFLPQFYSDDPQVTNIASGLLIIAVFFQLSDGTQVLALGALRGMHEVKLPTLITFIAYWVLGLVPAYVFGIILRLGPQGVWYGLALGLTFAAVMLYWRFEYKAKKMIHEKDV